MSWKFSYKPKWKSTNFRKIQISKLEPEDLLTTKKKICNMQFYAYTESYIHRITVHIPCINGVCG